MNPEKNKSPDKTVIKTGSSTYSFGSDWTSNEALNGILTGLIADDLTRIKDDDARK